MFSSIHLVNVDNEQASSSFTATKSDARYLFLISLVWLAMEIIVNPVGNFPLNDDWAYGYTVEMLMRTGHFYLSNWSAANLFSQALWGTLFCLPVGFSFTALRLSTIVIAIIGIFASYFLMREMKCNEKESFLGALLLACNPIYFGLSNTFMTDVPFFAFAVLSALFFLRALKYDTGLDILLAAIFSVLSILTRQIGIVISVAYACAYLIKQRVNFQRVLRAFWPAALTICAHLLFQFRMSADGPLPYAYGAQIHKMMEEWSTGPLHASWVALEIAVFSLIYLGLFLLPLLFLVLSFGTKSKRIRSMMKNFFTFAALTAFLYAIVRLSGRSMPFLGNILVDTGIGAFGLDETYQQKFPLFWKFVTATGLMASSFTVACFWNFIRNYRDEKWNAPQLFIICCLLFNLGLLCLLGLSWRGIYDRYLLTLLPFSSIAVLNSSRLTEFQKSRRTIASTLVILSFAFFSAAGTHDYLSANRSVWNALTQLIDKQRIVPDRIHGGFEFNGRFLYEVRAKDGDPSDIAVLWKNENADFLLSLRPLSGYTELRRYPFKTWLPKGESSVLILQKN